MRAIFISLRQWCLLAILCIAFAIFYYFQLYQYVTLDSLIIYQSKVVKHYQLTVSVYLILLTVLIACGIPCATIFTLLGGFLFGYAGFLYALIGITMGGMILFLAVRTAIGARLAAKSNSWISKMEKGFKQNAFQYLLMLRLVPIFPCGVSNIAAGVLNVPLKTFLLATTLGIAPATLIYILVGRGLDKVLNQNYANNLNLLTTPSILIPILAVIFLSLVPIIYKSIKRTA